MRTVGPSECALRVRVYTPFSRFLAAVLYATSRAGLLVVLGLVLLADDPPATPLALARLLALLTLLPGAAARLLRRALAGEVALPGETLVVRRRALEVEVPCDAIARVLPWGLPLPEPGFALGMRSGRRLGYALGAADPAPLLEALAERGVEAARAALGHRSVVYARARAAVGRPRWYHRAGKFPLFSLLPTAVLFNAHQHIAYGALLGEYYLLGLASYLATFAAYWTTVTVYLVLYAALCRGLTEAAVFVAAGVAPSESPRVRRAAETACRILYYGGVPLLLLLRFLA